MYETVTVCENVINYWEDRKLLYPDLYATFLSLACNPGSSAASERCFSESNIVISPKRSLIDPKKVNMTLVLNSHLKIKKPTLQEIDEILK